MPTYEYRCSAGHVFERFSQKITNKRTARCPTCGKRAERMISGGTGLVFKGSGFYATDYKRADAKAAKAEGDAKASDAKPTESGKAKKDSSSSDT